MHDLDSASGDDDPEPSGEPPRSAVVPAAFLTPLLLLLPSGALSSPPPATPDPGPVTSDTAAAEADGEAETAQEEDFLHVGGALRFNLLSTFYEGDRTPNSTQFTWDTWRINIQARTEGVGLQFEYRFYPTFNTHFIKEGWLEYAFDEETEVQVGVTQSPFGNVQYNSHNWWFQLPYYVGLEDDHDMGVKVLHRTETGWNLDVAYFLQPEPSGPAAGEASFGIGGSGRYSYDVVPHADQSNQEKHQLGTRLTRTVEHDGGASTELGGSLQVGGLYNAAVDEWNSRWAWAAHADHTAGPWNVKAQLLQYAFNPVDDDGADADVIPMGAYGIPYSVATEAWMAALAVQHSKDIEWGPFSQINFYDNYTYMGKSVDGFEPSHQNVLGFSVAAGGLFTYFDLAMGKNHPWITDSFGVGLGPGVEDASWNARFNVNVGYYF